jgi:uncharacterized protein YegP (UPF0339 family)
MRIELIPGRHGWHLRLYNRNARIKLASETFSSRTKCRQAAQSLARGMLAARVIEPGRDAQLWADGKLAA